VATFNDLEIEVRKLRQKVRRLEGGNAATRTVKEIVQSEDTDDKILGTGTTGGFAAACAQSRENLVKQQRLAAQRELQDNPGCVRTPAALHAFRRTYSAVPAVEIDGLIREFST
jgi:hypothetical protein